MLVCHCNAVCDRKIRECIRDGAKCVDDVVRSCQAGNGCGGCHETIKEVIEEMLVRERGAGDEPRVWQITSSAAKAA